MDVAGIFGFFKENGFEITGRNIFDDTLKLTYAEVVRGQG